MSVSELAKKTVSTLREEGVGRLLEKTKNYVGASLGGHGQKSKDKAFMDVLFINGCDKSVPHPPRYRVTHQREQLLAYGIESTRYFIPSCSWIRCAIIVRLFSSAAPIPT